MSRTRKLLSLTLALAMCLSLVGFSSAVASDDLSALPEAKFGVYGSELDRGVLCAKISSGVFIAWRYFPEEATGTTGDGAIGANGGLVGADFAIFKNGEKIADVTDSTDYIDASGTTSDEYVIVTVVGGAYVSKSEALKPIAQGSGSGTVANYLGIPLQRPPAATGLNTKVYIMDEIVGCADADGDGQLELVVKWQTDNPDVISQGYQAPVLFDCYKLDGTLLWRLNMGVNVRAGQHYLQPMFYDFDGDGKAEFMVQTAPGTKDGIGNYISMPETVHTRWDGTKNWSHTDDYRNRDGNTTAATRLSDNTTVQWMKNFFLNWQSHPDVMHAYYGENNEYDAYEDRGGFGWWKYPPQVMMGMYPAGYVGDSGTISSAGRHWASFTAQSTVAQWTQARWELLKAMPTDPTAFKSHVITEAEAEALALMWYVNNELDGGTRDRWKGSGHIMDGPEYFTVFSGETGEELDTIPYAVPRGIVSPDGSYTPDIGIMWNDFTGAWDEPYNRIERHNGGVAYLDGSGENPSCIQQRGYYSRTTVTRYDWDGENLTSQVLIDSGFEVSPNPFANGTGTVGGAVAYGNTHAGPGRQEACFNPKNPRVEKPESIATVEIANKNGSITCQGFHSMSAMDVDGDGFDELLMGNLCLNHDGSVRWTGYEQRYGTGSNLTKKTGAIEKLGHGDSLHVGYFDPNQATPKLWGCLEGAWWDSVLRDANTGTVLYTDGPASSTTAWGTQRDNGRAMVGKFTSESGWQLYANQSFHATPFGSTGDNRQGGLRQATGVNASSSTSNPGTEASIFWKPTLITSTVGGANGGNDPYGTAITRTIRSNNGAGGSFGNDLSLSNALCSGGTKGQAALAADIFGDYREELVVGMSSNTELRVYFNVENSTHKLATLQSDRRYGCEIARQNTTYNQPSYPGFYYGSDMNLSVYLNAITDPYRDPSDEPDPEPNEKILSVNYTGFVNLVNACAANVPVIVEAENPDGLAISAGLFVNGELVASASVADGKALIKAPVINGTSAYVGAWFGDDMGKAIKKTVPLRDLPSNIWQAEVIVPGPEGKTAVIFGDDIALIASATVKINGSPVVSFSTEGPILYIDAATVENDAVEMKGVKYPNLFPSYSFTFTAVRGPEEEQDPAPNADVFNFNFMSNTAGEMDGWTSIRISGDSGSPVSDALYIAAQGYGIVEDRAMMGRTRSAAATAMENTWIGGGGSAWQFRADVPDGDYKISVYCTDVGTGNATTNRITIDINGVNVSGGELAIKGSTSDPVVTPQVYNVTVTDGTLLFTFSGAQAYVNGIAIENVEA